MENIPVAELAPTVPARDAKAIKAVVTLIWPYSSSTKACAVLLAEPDFRLRRRKGQVRVRFTGPSARAVAKSGIGIGDEVALGLSGAKWLADAGEVKTPGRSVDWELEYGYRLVLEVARDEQQLAQLDIDEAEPAAPLEKVSPTPASPTPTVDRILGRETSSSWASPAFVKRVRLSSGPILDAYDPYAELDGSTKGADKKRRRRSWKDVNVWKYAARTPSPEKMDADEASAEEEEEEPLPEEEVVSPEAAAQLPQTPASAKQLVEDRSEPVADAITEAQISNRDVALQPEPDTDYADDTTEPHIEPPSAQVETMVEVGERHIDSVDLEMQDAVPWSDDLKAGAEGLSRTTEPQVPDAQQEAEHFDEDAEVDSDMYDVESSEEEDAGEESVLSGSDEDSEEYYSEEGPHIGFMPSEDDSDEWVEYEQSEVESRAETPMFQRQPEVIVLSDTDEEEEKGSVGEEPEGREDVDEGYDKPESDQEDSSHADNEPTVALEGAAVATPASVTVMPPPTLPLLQTNMASGSAGMRTPGSAVDAPRTPVLHPLASSTLPLPSPFPGETDSRVSSYIDHHFAVYPNLQRLAPGTGPEAASQLVEPDNSVETESDQVRPDSETYATDTDAQMRFARDYPFGLDGTTFSREKESVPKENMLDEADVQVEEAVSPPQAYQHDEPSHERLEEASEQHLDEVLNQPTDREAEDVPIGNEEQKLSPKLFKSAGEQLSIEADQQSVQTALASEAVRELSTKPKPTIIELSSEEDSEMASAGEPEAEEPPSSVQMESEMPQYPYEVSEDSEEEDGSVLEDEEDSMSEVEYRNMVEEPSELSVEQSPISDVMESKSGTPPNRISDSRGETHDMFNDAPPVLGSSSLSPRSQRRTPVPDSFERRPPSEVPAQHIPQETLPEQALTQTSISRTTEIIDLGSGSEEDEPEAGTNMMEDDTIMKIEPPTEDVHSQVLRPAIAASEATTADFHPLSSSSPSVQHEPLPEILDLSSVEPDYLSFRPTPRNSQIPLSQFAPGSALSSHLRREVIKDSEEGSVDSQRSLSTEPDGGFEQKHQPDHDENDVSMGYLSVANELPQPQPLYPILPDIIPETEPNVVASRTAEALEEEMMEVDEASHQIMYREQSTTIADEQAPETRDISGSELVPSAMGYSHEPRAPTPSPITPFVAKETAGSDRNASADVVPSQLSPTQESQAQPDTSTEERQENSLYKHSSYLHSNLLTPDPSQQLPATSPVSPEPAVEGSFLPVTPQLTQKTSALSFSGEIDPFKIATPPDKLKLQEAAVRFSFGGPPTTIMRTEQQPPQKARTTDLPSSPPETQDQLSSQISYTPGLQKEPHAPATTSGDSGIQQPPPPSTTRPISPPPYARPRTQGLRTKQSYYTPLASLSSNLNYPPSSQDASIDVLALVVRGTAAPKKAEAGPRDWGTVFSIADPSLFFTEPGAKGDEGEEGAATATASAQEVRKLRVQIFRPFKTALPKAEKGDIILLRNFLVKSRKGRIFLISGEASAWVVWRLGTRTLPEARVMANGSKVYSWMRGPSAQEVEGLGREECKGPPVEVGDEEREEARRLREWWARLKALRAEEAGDADDQESPGT